MNWLTAFTLTQLIECTTAALLLRRRMDLLSIVAIVFMATAITHPLLWFVWVRLPIGYAEYCISGEALVVIIEAYVYWQGWAKRYSLKRCLLWSLWINAISAFIGLSIQYGQSLIKAGA